MGLFSKPEVIILKESNDAKDYLQKLQDLLPKASGDVKEKIEKEIAIVNAGIYGEDNILFELKNSGMDLVVLHDIYIKTKSGLSAQIDFMVFAPKCIYIIECKNLFGNIEINSNGDFIRTFQYGKRSYKEGIYSPITQNERHMTVLKEMRIEDMNFIMGALKNSAFDTIFKGVVVLANPKTVVNDRFAKKEIKQKVIRADQLINFIKDMERQSKELPASLKTLKAYAESYLKHDCDERPDYLSKFEELVDEVESVGVVNDYSSDISDDSVGSKKAEKSDVISDNTSIVSEQLDALVCPRCGSALVLRTAKKGDNAGNQFYGCSAFPKCRYIRNL